jgi:hypothetical protein
MQDDVHRYEVVGLLLIKLVGVPIAGIWVKQESMIRLCNTPQPHRFIIRSRGKQLAVR